MKIIIFAGGAGKRFWPLSRVDTPKQFINIINKTSTFKEMVKKIQPVYGWYNIYISTNENYISTLKAQTPEISISNILSEPQIRDVGPALGLALIRLRKLGVHEPVAIIWADSLIKNENKFQDILKQSESMILKKEAELIQIGEKPTFANANIGWIKIGAKIKNSIHKFKGFVYRPSPKETEKIFNSGKALWNTGQFISTIDFLLNLYEKFSPKLYTKLTKIEKYIDTSKEASEIEKIYPKIEPIHSDHIVQYNLDDSNTKVIEADMGWDDPGTLYALKKYLQPKDDNSEKGKVYNYNSKDCLVYNYEKNKLVSTVGLESMVVVNTPDALLVVHKDHVKEISDMFKELEKTKYKKYL